MTLDHPLGTGREFYTSSRAGDPLRGESRFEELIRTHGEWTGSRS